MQKSLFKRYLGQTMLIVFLSFVILGGVMMVFFSYYWRQEKKELLTQNATSIANIASRFLTKESASVYKLQGDALQGFIDSFSASISISVLGGGGGGAGAD